MKYEMIKRIEREKYIIYDIMDREKNKGILIIDKPFNTRYTNPKEMIIQ